MLKESDLRCFRRAFLQELGYGLTLENDAKGACRLTVAGHYAYEIEHGGKTAAIPGSSALSVSKNIRSTANEDFRSAFAD